MSGHGSSIIFRDVVRWLNKATKKRRRYHHIVKGEIRRTAAGGWQARGLHHRFLGHDMPDRRVEPIERHVDGTHNARVWMKDPTGEWTPKRSVSTFFPDNWTPQRVNASIEEAFARRVDLPGGKRWRGSSNGLTIEGSYHRNGDWDSAWPVP